MMRALLLAALALPLLAAKSDPLAGRIAGSPERCISLNSQQGLYIADQNLILAQQTGRRIWRANTIGQCSMQSLDTLIVDVYGSQVCRNDRFRVLRNGTSIPGPFCRFESFTPYDKVPKG